MEIVIYQGPDIDSQSLAELAPEAAQAELHIRSCRTREELAQALREAALRELAATERFFPFKSTEGTQLLRLSQVLYFKSSGHRVVAVLSDGRELMGRTLRIPTSTLLEPLVQSGRFYQIFRSTFVNKVHVSGLGPNWVRLDNGTTMNVSRKYYQALLQENAPQGPGASV